MAMATHPKGDPLEQNGAPVQREVLWNRMGPDSKGAPLGDEGLDGDGPGATFLYQGRGPFGLKFGPGFCRTQDPVWFEVRVKLPIKV